MIFYEKKEEYDRLYNQRESEFDEWDSATDNVFDQIADNIKRIIGDTNLDLRIDVGHRLHGGITVKIDNGNPHDSQALNWNWTVQLTKDGELRTESGSWSGLDVTSKDKLDNLKESVRILEILNNMDWKTILNVTLPHIDEYVKTPAPVYDRFDEQLLELDVEDAAEKGLLIKGHGYRFYGNHATVFYNILSMTDKSFKVQEIHEDEVSDESKWGPSYLIRKDTFLEVIDNPIQTVEV